MKCQSILFTGKDKVELADETVADPGPDQILVQTTRSLISTGTESICLTRNFAPGTPWDGWVQYPFRPGYLSAGRVIAVGPNVTQWKVGDRLACRAEHRSHHLLRAGVTTASAFPGAGDANPQFLPVRIPDGVTDADAAWMGLGKITQVGVRAAQHVLGDSVVVIGLGLLGQLVVQYARILGAAEVIAIDMAPRRLEMAAAHGATRTLNLSAADALPLVKQYTDGRGADVVYDVTGHPAVFAAALALPRRFGTMVLLGDAGSPALQHLTSDLIGRGLRIVGAHDAHTPPVPNDFNRWATPQMYDLIMAYLARGQLRVADLVTHHFKPQQAPEAYALLQRDRLNAMGVMFDWA